jgi:protein-tyrosine phosphatase
VTQQDKQIRRLVWDGCYNVRDLGGYPIQTGGQTRWKTLIRSDTLHTLTPEGRAAFREYGARTIIDIRLAHEVERDPSPFATLQEADNVPRYLNLPIHVAEIDPEISPPVDPQVAYIVILEKSKELIARIIKAVAASVEDGCVLVHCQGGKDRTGIIIALLLSLAGVQREAIVEDYALSEAMLKPLYLKWVEEQIKATGKHPGKPKYVQARPETMYGVLAHLDREYGGVEGYLKAAGVTQAEIEKIHDHLTLRPIHGG